MERAYSNSQQNIGGSQGFTGNKKFILKQIGGQVQHVQQLQQQYPNPVDYQRQQQGFMQQKDMIPYQNCNFLLSESG
jgi:hypothetical protein